MTKVITEFNPMSNSVKGFCLLFHQNHFSGLNYIIHF